MSIIEDLKKNEKPFGLMSEEMQEKAKEIGFGHFERWIGGIWYNQDINDWYTDSSYRLRPDYTEEPEEPEEPEVVKCEVRNSDEKGWLDFKQHGVEEYWSLYMAPAMKDFIGFLYEDGYVCPELRGYENSDGQRVYAMLECDAPSHKVLTPTHVLFRGSHES